jgi:hypothetical protein
MRTSGGHEVVEEADACAQKIIKDFKMLAELTETVL